MSQNELDVYWLRAKLRKELPERLYTQYGYTYSVQSDILLGIELVLGTLTDLTGVDFNKIS